MLVRPSHSVSFCNKCLGPVSSASALSVTASERPTVAALATCERRGGTNSVYRLQLRREVMVTCLGRYWLRVTLIRCHGVSMHNTMSCCLGHAVPRGMSLLQGWPLARDRDSTPRNTATATKIAALQASSNTTHCQPAEIGTRAPCAPLHQPDCCRPVPNPK
jgi:hypothetical protein